jgi:DNA-binding response OmpR family regulator
MAEVFVVEDDADLVYIYRTALAQAGHQVTMARNGREARAALAQTVPDVVFLDMNMPDESGASLIAFMRGDARYNATQIVVVTANQLWQSEIRRSDVAEFLVKPVSIRELVDVANALTG